MAGGSTTVNEIVRLPAQPTTGLVDYVPLGGDGYTAPFAAYSIVDMEVAGDASAGHVRMAVEMDPRFASLVAFFVHEIQQGTPATADVRLSVAGPQVPSQTMQDNVDDISSTVADSNISLQFAPTPYILPGGHKAGSVPRIFSRSLNVDGDTYRLSALIYLFNIRVREVTPMGPLLWARGST